MKVNYSKNKNFVNEVFKCASAGSDLKQSLPHMLNKTKDTQVILDIMKNPAYGRQSISRSMRIVAPIPR